MGVIEARRRILLSAPHVEATTPAGVANFQTDLISPLKSLKAGFLPVQAGTGDPSPSNVRAITGWSGLTVTKCGKNLFDKNNATVLNAYLENNGTIVTSSWSKCVVVQVHGGQTYTVSKMISARFAIGQSTKVLPEIGDTYTNRMTDASSSSQTFTTNADTKSVIMWIYASNIDTESFDTIVASLQLELGSAPTTYSPYTGTTIPVTFPAAGKNLLNNTAESKESKGITFAVNSDGSVSVTGANDGTGYSNIVVNSSFNMEDGVSYILNGGYSSDVFIRDVTAAVSSIGSDTTIVGDGRTHNIEIRVKSGTSISGTVTVKPMIRLATIADATYEPFRNAYYGGYVDLVKGEVVAEYAQLIIKSTDVMAEYIYQNMKGVEVKNALPSVLTRATGLCNYSNKVGAYYTSNSIWVGVSDRNIFWIDIIDILGLANVNEFKTWLDNNSVQIVYKLAIPITYPLTPQVIKSLRGTNNIWSDANGDVSVEYWKH